MSAMDVEEPFRYQAPPYPQHHSEERQSVASSRSSQLASSSRRRSSHSGHAAGDRSQRPMSIIARRPPPIRGPVTFNDEVPAPPISYQQPPPLAPYVTPEHRVHPPRVTSWGRGPDPGLERHQQSNPHPSLPPPIHHPPRGDNWRRVIHANQDHPYTRPKESDHGAHARGQIVHPPPLSAQTRVVLPSIHDALSHSSMERSWSHASEPAMPMSRTYSRSHAGSYGSRPSSHGSSGGDLSPNHLDGSQSAAQKRRRTRALMTDMQQVKLKQLWKQTKFPSKNDREELGEMIGLTPRQVQVWFQNQRQKTRKEMTENGVPLGADPRDYDDLDKSPRSRRMSLEAADANTKVQQWSAAQLRLGARSLGANDEPGPSHQSDSRPLHRELKHIIKNPDVRPAQAGHRLAAHHSEDREGQPRQMPISVPPIHTATPHSQWSSGYRSPAGPLSPISHAAMSPRASPSPTQGRFPVRPVRQRPVPSAISPPALTEPHRSPVDGSFGDGVPMRHSRTIDGIMSIDTPRRRSTSLEGMRPGRSPSPPNPPSKRSRTLTVTSELPPTLAALALSAPVSNSSDSLRQLPSLTSHNPGKPPRETYMGPPPTLPPPRGPAHDRRLDGQFRSHTDSTSITLQREAQRHSRLPGPGNLLRNATDYR